MKQKAANTGMATAADGIPFSSMNSISGLQRYGAHKCLDLVDSYCNYLQAKKNKTEGVVLDTEDMDVYRHRKIQKKHFIAFLKDKGVETKPSYSIDHLISIVSTTYTSLEFLHFLKTDYKEPKITSSKSKSSKSKN